MVEIRKIRDKERKLLNNYYRNIVNTAKATFIPWEKLKNKTILLSGATGMIGKCLIDLISERNEKFNDNIKIIALGRSLKKAEERLKLSDKKNYIQFIELDINIPFSILDNVDYIIDAASNTHPIQYATEPIETIKTNVYGLNNMLQIAKEKNARLVFLSSVEVYGQNRGDTEFFDEKYCGYIDSNTLRAGYPESKRLGEALCQAYKSADLLDVCIARLSRIYGFTMQEDDSKVIAQFIKKATNGEDIVLKSDGTQQFGYTNVIDAVTGILMVMLLGKNGEAYNIEDEKSRIVLKELAQYIAQISDVNVKFELPDDIEKKGYSCANKAIMNNEKIKELSWKATIDIYSGVKMMLEDLKK